MRRAALLALASLAAAGEPEVRLPGASAATKPVAGAAVVNLTADGLVVVEKEGRPESVSLDQLGLWLRERATKFDDGRKANGGGSAKPQGLDLSEMPVLLRADERAPWGHVQMVLALCAEERVNQVGFGVKGAGGEEGRLPAELPVDREPSAPAPRSHGPAKITVRIEVTREEIGVWGPTQTPVTKPAEITFRMGETDATDVEKVRRYIRDAYQTASAANPASIAGEIKASSKIPFGVVISVLNEYHRAGLPAVRFHVASAPAPEERRATRLPYPSR